MSIATKSPRLAKCAGRASPTCLLPLWEIRNQRSKKANEYDARSFNGIAHSRVCHQFTDSTSLLVGVAGGVGKPLHIYSAADRRRRPGVRVRDYHNWSGRPQTGRVVARPGTPASRHRAAVRLGGDDDDLHLVHRWCVLLSGRAVRRTSRSQHPVLEIAAGFGSHHRSIKGDHSAGGSAGDRLCDHGLRADDYGAGNQRSPHLPWYGSGDDVGPHTVLSELVGAALRSDRDCALACADLRLAVAGFRLGASRHISLGGVTFHRDPNIREDHVRHLVFRFHAETPSDGIRTARFRFPRRGTSHNRLAGTTHSGNVPEQRRSMAWAAVRSRIHRRSGATAPLSRTTVIKLHA